MSRKTTKRQRNNQQNKTQQKQTSQNQTPQQPTQQQPAQQQPVPQQQPAQQQPTQQQPTQQQPTQQQPAQQQNPQQPHKLTLDDMNIDRVIFDVGTGCVTLKLKYGDIELNDYNTYVVYDDSNIALSIKEVSEKIESTETELTEDMDPYIVYAINQTVEMLKKQNKAESKESFENLRKRLIEQYKKSINAIDIEEGEVYASVTYTKAEVEEEPKVPFGILFKRKFENIVKPYMLQAKESPNVFIDESINTKRNMADKIRDLFAIKKQERYLRLREGEPREEADVQEEEEDLSLPLEEDHQEEEPQVEQEIQDENKEEKEDEKDKKIPMPEDVENKLREAIVRGIKANKTEREIMAQIAMVPEYDKYMDFGQIAVSIMYEEMAKEKKPKQQSQQKKLNAPDKDR